MKSELEKFFNREIEGYKKAIKLKDDKLCYVHLGRAHILSQKNVFMHLKVHWLMFKYAFKKKKVPEILGQALRLAVTIPGHLFGKLPSGNIGWSNVGLTEKMPVPEDLKEIYFSSER